MIRPDMTITRITIRCIGEKRPKNMINPPSFQTDEFSRNFSCCTAKLHHAVFGSRTTMTGTWLLRTTRMAVLPIMAPASMP